MELMMLIGLPGVGKSTFIQNKWSGKDFTLASTDMWIDSIAMAKGISYNEAFTKEGMKWAEQMMNKAVQQAIEEERDVVWDQTNLTVRSRARKLAQFPKHYSKIAVVLLCDIDTHAERLASRPDKKIPPHLIESMRDSYQEPTRDEGFSAVLFYNVVNGEWSEIAIGNL